MIACIDGGLICGPVLLVLGALGIVGFVQRMMFKFCRRSCKCACHTKKEKR